MTSIVGFIIGFAMFGAITYLPALLPGRPGLLADALRRPAAAADGRAAGRVDRVGPAHLAHRRYRFFPIAGPAVTAVGLYLLSLMGAGTPAVLESLYMLVLGMGIGGVMQVLVIIVQNAVPHSELGVATSGATFFRSIGGSFGTAIFGAIFSNVLVGNLATQLHGVHAPGRLPQPRRHAGPAGCPPPCTTPSSTATRDSIQTVFIVAVPIAALAFLATWLSRRWS